MYEECKNQWSMSRPLLGLILLNQEARHKYPSEDTSPLPSPPPPYTTLLFQYFKSLVP